MGKKLSLFLAFILAFALPASAFTLPVKVFASYNILSSSTTGKVIEIVDGETFVILPDNKKTEAFIKMIGIDAKGNDDSYDYLNNNILGKKVTVTPDFKIKTPVDKFNMMYVFVDGKLLNSTLLNKGYAVINDDDKVATKYKELLKAQSTGKDKELVLNKPAETPYENKDDYYHYESNDSFNVININTATVLEFRTNLNNVGNDLATAIVKYRDDTIFNNIEDILNVPGFTQDIFNKNRRYLSTKTNLNKASESELESLLRFTEEQAKAIIEYRKTKEFKTTIDVYNKGLIPYPIFMLNRPFLTVEDETEVYGGYTIVNANTATYSQLLGVGLTGEEATTLIDFRKDKILYNYDGLGFTSERIEEISKNLHFITNVNTATLNELHSLFGSKTYYYDYADDIISGRKYNNVFSLVEVLGYSLFFEISPYISISSEYKMYDSIEEFYSQFYLDYRDYRYDKTAQGYDYSSTYKDYYKYYDDYYSFYKDVFSDYNSYYMYYHIQDLNNATATPTTSASPTATTSPTATVTASGSSTATSSVTASATASTVALKQSVLSAKKIVAREYDSGFYQSPSPSAKSIIATRNKTAEYDSGYTQKQTTKATVTKTSSAKPVTSAKPVASATPKVTSSTVAKTLKAETLSTIDKKATPKTEIAIVNVNTGSKSQLISAGLTNTEAEKIISYRDSKPIKLTNELANNVVFSNERFKKISKNINAVTNINTASDSEIESVFGSVYYGFIYADDIIKYKPYIDSSTFMEHLPTRIYYCVSDYIKF